MLNNLPFREPAFRDLIAARFAAQGVDRDRLELIATAPQSATWAAYGGIDIALDPFPHNAGTTTIEALWQGVPVVSLAGRPSVGRFGAMILHAVGMDDWVSADTDGYVACALAAAADLHSARTGACHAAPACRRFAAVRCGGTGAGTSRPRIARCGTHAEHRIVRAHFAPRRHRGFAARQPHRDRGRCGHRRVREDKAGRRIRRRGDRPRHGDQFGMRALYRQRHPHRPQRADRRQLHAGTHQSRIRRSGSADPRSRDFSRAAAGS